MVQELLFFNNVLKFFFPGLFPHWFDIGHVFFKGFELFGDVVHIILDVFEVMWFRRDLAFDDIILDAFNRILQLLDFGKDILTPYVELLFPSIDILARTTDRRVGNLLDKFCLIPKSLKRSFSILHEVCIELSHDAEITPEVLNFVKLRLQI